MYLYPNIYLKSLEQLFCSLINYIIKEEPIFVLTKKIIFDRVAQSQLYSSGSRLFTKKKDQKPVAIYLEVCEKQVHEVMSAI